MVFLTVPLVGTMPFHRDKVADLYRMNAKMKRPTIVDTGSPIVNGTLSSKAHSRETSISAKLMVPFNSSNDDSAKQAFAQNFLRFLTTDEYDVTSSSITLHAAPRSVAKGFERLFDISNSTGISSEALDLITEFLTVDEHTRLGSGKHGGRKVRRHPFFKDINWNSLLQKNVPAPYIPPALIEEDDNPICYDDFEDMLVDLDKGAWMDDLPQHQEQQYFASWCVIYCHIEEIRSLLQSPYTLYCIGILWLQVLSRLNLVLKQNYLHRMLACESSHH